MTIPIGRYQFAGPFDHPSVLEDRAGMYAILDVHAGRYRVLDIGESAQVRTRVSDHDRAGCWQRNASSRLYVAVHYTPYRFGVEQELRGQFNPVCGQR